MWIFATSPIFRTRCRRDPSEQHRLFFHSTEAAVQRGTRTPVCAAVFFLALVCAVPVVAQTTHTVQLLPIQFSPPNLTVRVGETVHWVWTSGFHNVESGTVSAGTGVHDGRFRSGNPTLTAGTAFDVRFDEAFLSANSVAGNVYPYYCVVHASIGMVGAITVAHCLGDADCQDANPCTDSRCDAGVCILSANAASCDDGNPCTSPDVCAVGLCSGPLVAGCCRAHGECNDGNICTADFCENGGCRASPISLNLCDDGNPCTDSDACNQGQCTGTLRAVCCAAATECDDANPCTNDQCVGGICIREPNQASCEDDDACTDEDTCSDGACRGRIIPDCCESDEDCPREPCHEVLCVERRCRSEPTDDCETCDGEAACDDEDACTDDRCVQEECRRAFNESPCDDGDLCTTDDVCRAGSCAGQARLDCCHADHDCDDQDACTDDVCVASACAHLSVADCEISDDPEEPPTTPADEPVEQGLPRPRLCGVGAIPALLCCGLIGLASRRNAPLSRSTGAVPIRLAG